MLSQITAPAFTAADIVIGGIPNSGKSHGPRAWLASLPSLGLTLDTPFGPVDLVAIERAIRGHSVPLSGAEYTWLRCRTAPAYGRDVAADRLGIDRARFAQLLRRWREENYPADTPEGIDVD
ncbi:MAG TPA: hypothetical protein VL551_22010 [Actinospica sp.]|jgi:hypothetical protein|nr:hypothetical protein [Actinospica sp.]